MVLTQVVGDAVNVPLISNHAEKMVTTRLHACPDLASYAQQGASIDANLAHAFHSQCNLKSSTPDWYVDSGASSHMTNSSSHLDSSSSYTGKDQVVVGNGNVLNISHIGNSIIYKSLTLMDVLVVPHLTKNFLSISKLTHDSPVDFLLYDNFFSIQNCITKEIISKGRCQEGL